MYFILTDWLYDNKYNQKLLIKIKYNPWTEHDFKELKKPYPTERVLSDLKRWIGIINLYHHSPLLGSLSKKPNESKKENKPDTKSSIIESQEIKSPTVIWRKKMYRIALTSLIICAIGLALKLLGVI